MINNQECEKCKLSGICVAENKLKPFTDEAKTDLGVELDFVGCERFTKMEE